MKKIGVVGTGFMGQTHADAWKETDAVIHRCFAKTIEIAKPFSEKYSVEISEDIQSLLNDVDIVDICTPTFLHKDMVLKAAAVGKDIICEKPLGLSVEDCAEMINACREANVKLFVAHVTRFFPEYATAHDAVIAGEIGKIATQRYSREGFQPFNPNDNWYVDYEKSGGMIQDLMIHDFDLARWMAGDVVRVFAKNLVFTNEKVPFDHAMVILTHKNGAISHITGSWAQPKPRFRTSFEIAGDAGLIQWDSQTASPLQIMFHKTDDEGGDVGLPGAPLLESPYTSEIKEFFANIENDAPVRVMPEDGLAAVQIARAALESAKTGRAVEIQSIEEVLG